MGLRRCSAKWAVAAGCSSAAEVCARALESCSVLGVWEWCAHTASLTPALLPLVQAEQPGGRVAHPELPGGHRSVVRRGRARRLPRVPPLRRLPGAPGRRCRRPPQERGGACLPSSVLVLQHLGAASGVFIMRLQCVAAHPAFAVLVPRGQGQDLPISQGHACRCNRHSFHVGGAHQGLRGTHHGGLLPNTRTWCCLVKTLW